MTIQQNHRAEAVCPVLVVGHPGHELRVYGWLTRMRPVVHVLTDGSGSDGKPRLKSTTALLADAGASRGSIYGRMSDREIYAAILAGDHARFVGLAEELAAAFIRDNVDLGAGDAVEGFNPSHDVCRYLINAAVRLASVGSGRPIGCYAFPLDGAPDFPVESVAGGALRMDLDDALLDRKLRAAHAYPELRSEVESALHRYGTEPFRTEHLWPVDLSDPYGGAADRVPFYESYGAQRVASGAYEHVVTFREHVRPLADALWCRCAVTA
jgi:hypothetical protein